MAYGNLGAVIDTLTYFDGSAYCNESCLVTGEICAVTLRRYSYENYCRTFSIDGVGNISDSVIDSLNVTDNVIAEHNRFAKLSPTLYALATSDNHRELNLDTFEILANGQISDTVLDADLWPPEGNYPGTLKKVGPGMLAVFIEENTGAYGDIWTILVHPDGTIEHDLVDTLRFESTYCKVIRAAKIHPGIWAIAYQASGPSGKLVTVSISPTGIIGDSLIDTLTFDGAVTSLPTPVKAHGNFLAIGYRASNDQGKLAIVEISEAGLITDSVIDTYIFETGTAMEPFTYSIGQGYIGVAYQNAANHGILKTFLVDENGHLNSTTIDTLDYAPDGSNDQYVFHVAGDVWAVCHHAAADTGRVTSFGLETPPDPEGPRDLMRGMLR